MCNDMQYLDCSFFGNGEKSPIALQEPAIGGIMGGHFFSIRRLSLYCTSSILTLLGGNGIKGLWPMPSQLSCKSLNISAIQIGKPEKNDQNSKLQALKI